MIGGRGGRDEDEQLALLDVIPYQKATTCKYVLSQQFLHVTYEPRPLQMGIPPPLAAGHETSEAVLP